MLKVLVVDDTDLTTSDVCSALTASGIAFDAARSQQFDKEMLLLHQYAAIILRAIGIGAPELSVMKNIRETGISVPILSINNFSCIPAHVESLHHGCDATLSAPFDADELCACLEGLVHDRTRMAKKDLVMRVNGIELNFASRTVMHQQMIKRLRPIEFRLLKYMMRHAGQVLTRNMIFEAVWGGNLNLERNPVDQQIGRLRRKLDAPDQPSRIRTIRGSGYQLL